MKQQILNYLKTQHLMSLATANKNKPWACTVYFTVDNDLNLYFVSPPESDHCRFLTKNTYVSCSIYDSGQNVNSKKEGLQLRGTAEVLSNVADIKKALELWNKANPGAEQYINYDNMEKKIITSKVYKITPAMIKYFNETLYGDKESKVFRLS